ncbi:SDR family NAD(P)-dependent oxidoreductase, partial [Spirillospora sp. NPDC046719]
MIDQTASYLSGLFSLEGRTAVVTGGSSGIGRAIAVALARAGASVVVVARREPELADTVRELESHGCRAARVSADLGSRGGGAGAGRAEAGPGGEAGGRVNAGGGNRRPPE